MLFLCYEIAKRKVASRRTESNGLSIFLRIRGIAKGWVRLFSISGVLSFFDKTDFELYLAKFVDCCILMQLS